MFLHFSQPYMKICLFHNLIHVITSLTGFQNLSMSLVISHFDSVGIESIFFYVWEKFSLILVFLYGQPAVSAPFAVYHIISSIGSAVLHTDSS